MILDWRRLWQPDRPAFWLMLVFNALSSAMAWALHGWQPSGLLFGVLSVFALGNAAMGWWMLALLWRPGPVDVLQGENHVQSPAGQQDR